MCGIAGSWAKVRGNRPSAATVAEMPSGCRRTSNLRSMKHRPFVSEEGEARGRKPTSAGVAVKGKPLRVYAGSRAARAYNSSCNVTMVMKREDL